MKKIIPCFLVLLMVFSCLTGCSSIADKLGELATEGSKLIATEPVSMEMSGTELAEYAKDRTVTVETDSGTGSGFFIDDKGTLVTCYHVIDAANEISVKLSDGGIYEVEKVVDFNDILDIAILSVNITGNKYFSVCENGARTGETVYAIGSSLGFLEGSFSNGVVSSADRKVGIIECVQSTAAISGGNSGGPLVNTLGEVIGINAFSYPGENTNLAVKISLLDTLERNRNWSMSEFREWYTKETKRSYSVWNYTTDEWIESKVHTYQQVTGVECLASDFSWEYVDNGESETLIDGYRDYYGVYYYTYTADEFDSYTAYLQSRGFVFSETEDFSQGTMYYYEDEFNGFSAEILVSNDETVVVVEICSYSNY